MSDETLSQIEKDLPRTMSASGVMQPGASPGRQSPSPLSSRRPGSPVWDSVKRILRAYAAHDPSTGYVQARPAGAA